MGIIVHPGLPGSLGNALILIVSPKLPGSAIGNFITQRPFTHIGLWDWLSTMIKKPRLPWF